VSSSRLAAGFPRLLLAAVVALAACRPSPLDAVGVSDKRVSGTSAAPDAGPMPPSPVPADFREHMTKVLGRQLSRGHGERFDAIVWANDAAKGAWDAGGEMPDGAVLVEEAIERVGSGAGRGDRPAGLLLMEKGEGAWRFRAVGPEGSVAEEARCGACHAQAPRDRVFRVDQSSSAASAAASTATVPAPVATMAATVDTRSAGPADASVRP
jgi:hypothetical protein